MSKKSSVEVEDIKLFTVNLMNEEQDKYSKLCADLNKALDTGNGTIKAFYDTRLILGKLFSAKMDVLEKILKKVQAM